MIKLTTTLLLVGALMSACTHAPRKGQTASQAAQADSTYYPKYAKGFHINYFKGYRQIVMNDPWGDTTRQETLALVADAQLKPSLSKTHTYVLPYPATRWIALSSTMVNYADKLNKKQSICGVAEPRYIADEYIQSAIKDGSIRNVGMSMSPDVEVMVDLEPDFLMVSPFKDNHFAAVKSAGIPIITNADYLEHTPLGRAEWLVLMGELLGEGKTARQLFNAIEKEYQSVKDLAQKVKNKPSVFTGHLYQGAWYSPAGESYMANFFKDAGSNYIYSNTVGTGSLTLDYETIITRAEHTDYWVMIMNYPDEVTYEEIKKMDERYIDFDAYKKQQIVITNAAYSGYFEEGLLQPHFVLSDLVHALHPGLLKNYRPRYFHHLTEE
ncbi:MULTISPECIES: ABC transporter substrate-binding protein [unclassified Carboxylicivirga]|uniref:ABC transporter substrate-binding protein n=1 Tax=Carboxylicivirga TaxID=1628153 RepID=UPI003D3367CF